MTASIVSLYIINKYGGMVYNNQFSGKDLLSNNDHLRLASTFHGYDLFFIGSFFFMKFI